MTICELEGNFERAIPTHLETELSSTLFPASYMHKASAMMCILAICDCATRILRGKRFILLLALDKAGFPGISFVSTGSDFNERQL